MTATAASPQNTVTIPVSAVPVIGPPRGAPRGEWDRSLAAYDAARAADLARIRFWGHDTVLVNRPEWIHELLVERADDYRKGPLLSVNAKPLLGDGLLTGPNDVNRRQRRLISPAFAHKKVAEYTPLMARYVEREQAKWRDGDVLDVPQAMLSVTLGVIGELLLSADLLETAAGVGDAIVTLMNFAIDELRAPLRAALSVPRALSALLFLNRTIYRQIERRRAAGDEEADLLARMLFARDEFGVGMGDRMVRHEAMTVFLAGLETVATALAWSWYLLDAHPDWYARLRAEADAVLGDRTDAPEFADVERLTVATCVWKEAMRLYPPAYIIARQALRPTAVGPYRLPKGTVVFVSPYVLHRSPAFWTAPDAFDPFRWSGPAFEKGLPRYAYLPFGGGPRVCVGGHFAMLEGPLILATLARRVTFSLVPGQTVVPEPLFTLRPRHGLNMRVSRRAPASATVGA